MGKFGPWIVKNRIKILIISTLLLIPAILGIIQTKINYDILEYLPKYLDNFSLEKYNEYLIPNITEQEILLLKQESNICDYPTLCNVHAYLKKKRRRQTLVLLAVYIISQNTRLDLHKESGCKSNNSLPYIQIFLKLFSEILHKQYL